jgi:hypothetical protein
MNELASRATGRDGSVGSERFRLARLARDAALRVSGVVATDSGPNGLFVTVDGGERLEGVLCVATRDGSYEITLRLICRLVPLLALSAQVKAGVRRTADVAGLPVQSVSVHVAELTDGEDS